MGNWKIGYNKGYYAPALTDKNTNVTEYENTAYGISFAAFFIIKLYFIYSMKMNDRSSPAKAKNGLFRHMTLPNFGKNSFASFILLFAK